MKFSELSKLKNNELKYILKQNKIKNYSNMNKAELLKKIKEIHKQKGGAPKKDSAKGSKAVSSSAKNTSVAVFSSGKNTSVAVSSNRKTDEDFAQLIAKIQKSNRSTVHGFDSTSRNGASAKASRDANSHSSLATHASSSAPAKASEDAKFHSSLVNHASSSDSAKAFMDAKFKSQLSSEIKASVSRRPKNATAWIKNPNS